MTRRDQFTEADAERCALLPVDEDEALAAQDFVRYEDERFGQCDEPVGWNR